MSQQRRTTRLQVHLCPCSQIVAKIASCAVICVRTHLDAVDCRRWKTCAPCDTLELTRCQGAMEKHRDARVLMTQSIWVALTSIPLYAIYTCPSAKRQVECSDRRPCRRSGSRGEAIVRRVQRARDLMITKVSRRELLGANGCRRKQRTTASQRKYRWGSYPWKCGGM